MRQRVRIVYDGHEFTIPGIGTEEMRRRVDQALNGEDPWLEVTSGLGRGVPAFLRMTPGVPIALFDESPEAEHDPEGPEPEHDPVG